MDRYCWQAYTVLPRPRSSSSLRLVHVPGPFTVTTVSHCLASVHESVQLHPVELFLAVAVLAFLMPEVAQQLLALVLAAAAGCRLLPVLHQTHEYCRKCKTALIPCSDCFGTGRQPNGMKCPCCWGTGLLCHIHGGDWQFASIKAS